MSTQERWLVVGLGNPGPSYKKHRHNFGFMAIHELAERYALSPSGQKFSSVCWQGSIAGASVIAITPQTYMNRSGMAVGEAARFFKIPLERVVVIHDELDLPIGKMRIKCGGGHGGHNGLKDIDRTIGQGYWRLRLGIGHPGHKEQVHGHVLSDFTASEWVLSAPLINAVAQHFPFMFKQEPERLMNAVALQLGDNT
ncbi:MAG: aminoacyl-tRNA hydrolase [Rickettsiales bacterium]|nr:aminoacyl-tRNA hydrolase [Rickettsiales bacterium]